MKQINKDMIIAEVLEIDADLAPFFLQIGMHCLGCPSAKGETVEEACFVHGEDCDALLARMNDFLKAKEN